MSEFAPKLAKLSEGFNRLELMKYNDGPPVGRAVTLRLVSNDDKIRNKYVSEIYDYLSTVPGVENLEKTTSFGKKEIKVMPNIAQMNRLGVSTSTLAQTIRVAFEGVEIGSLTIEGEEVPFYLTLDKSQIDGNEIISQLQVPNNLGQLIDVSRMVKISEVSTLESISRYNGRRTTGVLADINEKITTSAEVNRLIQEKFGQKVSDDPSVNLVVGGERKIDPRKF